jgi:hypothetical protein
MRKHWPAVLAVASLVTISAQTNAQEQAGAPKSVSAEAAVGTAVADRALTGAADTFKADVGKLYCFAKINNAADTDVEFVWYKGDAEMGRIKQTIKRATWRTWSSKTLGDSPTGDWRCDVVQNGNVLQSVKFKVEP